MNNVSSFQNRLKAFLALSLLALLIGCSLYPDVNQDPAKNNKATFQRDAIECAQAYPDTGGGAYIRQRINCMKLKGWQ